MSMNNNPIDQDPIDFIEETAAIRIGARIRRTFRRQSPAI